MRAVDHGCAQLFRSFTQRAGYRLHVALKVRVGYLHLQLRRGVGTYCVVGPK